MIITVHCTLTQPAGRGTPSLHADCRFGAKEEVLHRLAGRLMASWNSLLLLLGSSLLFCFINVSLFDTRTPAPPIADTGNSSLHARIYIVHVQDAAEGGSRKDREAWHRSFLPSPALHSGKPRLVYSYTHAISGFAARLTPKEVEALEAKDGFLHAYPSRRRKPRTTRSPSFLGLKRGSGLWGNTNCGKGVIIGVVDYGVEPTHPSFDDDGMPDPPSTWEGGCGFDDPSFCNKKIIGAIGLREGQRVSPMDADGHGTSTAGIAAGNFVEKANFLGVAEGTAAGIAPRAHLAIYKVCFEDDANDCDEADILAGVDQAIIDGVHVLSISLGGDADFFYRDGTAMGSFAATKSGIFVSASAGNDGPTAGKIENDAPWMLTVGASTLDRSLRATVKLGNKDELAGESAYQPTDFPPTLLRLVYPGARGDPDAMACKKGSLDKMDVKGKVVMCHVGGDTDQIDKGAAVKDAGGAAMILMNGKAQQYSVEARAHVLPASHITYADSLKLLAYYKTPNPKATIVFQVTLLGISGSPTVGDFSARGPSKMNGGILKPDIVGPGVSILVASPGSSFYIDDGTSLATPHLAGIAAMLKTSHPEWSPAAIKSAIMTSSDLLNGNGKPIADETSKPASLFAIGAGHVNPARANDPGLVYDLQADDFIPYLCGLKYDDNQVSRTVRRPIKCSDLIKIDADQLNYPSFALSLPRKRGSSRTIPRTVTNVGEEDSVYRAKIDEPKGVKVSVYPNLLEFSKADPTLSFTVRFTVTGDRVSKGSVSEGQFRWRSGKKYRVRSPISITFT